MERDLTRGAVPGHLLAMSVPVMLGFLAQTLQPWAAELGRRLKPVLELGWLHLTKRQYNWVVVLARLSARPKSTKIRPAPVGQDVSATVPAGNG